MIPCSEAFSITRCSCVPVKFRWLEDISSTAVGSLCVSLGDVLVRLAEKTGDVVDFIELPHRSLEGLLGALIRQVRK